MKDIVEDRHFPLRDVFQNQCDGTGKKERCTFPILIEHFFLADDPGVCLSMC